MITKSLKFRLPLYLLVITTIPLLAMSIFAYSSVSDTFVKQKLGDMMNIIDVKYIHVLDMLDKGKVDSASLAASPSIVEGIKAYSATGDRGSLDKATQFLQQTIKENRLTKEHPFDRKMPTRDRYREFFIMDKKGTVIASTRADHVGHDMSTNEFFLEGQKSSSVVDPHADNAGGGDGAAVFGFTAPIYANPEAGKGAILGVLGTKIDVGILEMIMTGEIGNLTGGALWFAGYSEKLDFYIMNKEGQMITQSMVIKENTVLKRQGSPAPLERGLDVNATGSRITSAGIETGAREVMEVYTNYDGAQVAGASMVIFDELWTMVIEDSVESAFAPINSLKTTLTVATLLIALLAAVAGYLLSLRVAAPLSELGHAAESLAGGDLDSRVEVSDSDFDEAAVLGHAFNRMAASLKLMIESEKKTKERLEKMVGNIKTAIEDIASASSEIFAATTQHNSSATEQASSINQTTTTIDEVRQTAEQATERAQSVAAAAEKSVEISGSGMTAVEQTISGMDKVKEKVTQISTNILELSEQTQQIGNIISTVNDIAEQSNLLALNASIEASRAGEQGKGFAVVAAEVRNLAEQSQQATAQVKTILDDIQKATNTVVIVTEEGTRGADSGMELARKAGETIRSMVEAIGDSTETAQQIVASARQQAAGMDQIAIAMNNVNQSTTQNLATTKQTEQAAQKLSELGGRLKKLVSEYAIDLDENEIVEEKEEELFEMIRAV